MTVRSLDEALSILDESECSPACLFAESDDCQCRCEAAWHGWARGRSAAFLVEVPVEAATPAVLDVLAGILRENRGETPVVIALVGAETRYLKITDAVEPRLVGPAVRRFGFRAGTITAEIG